jgi:hypothetical protein
MAMPGMIEPIAKKPARPAMAKARKALMLAKWARLIDTPVQFGGLRGVALAMATQSRTTA